MGPEQESKKSNSESKQMQLENICPNDQLKDAFIMILIQTYNQSLILFFYQFVSDNNVSVSYTGFKANLFIFRSFDDVGSRPSKAPLTFVLSQP